MEIHVLLADVQLGPYSENEVRRHLSEGLLSPSDLARHEGMTEWQAVDVVLAHLPPSSSAKDGTGAGPTPRRELPLQTTLPLASPGEVDQMPFAAESQDVSATPSVQRRPARFVSQKILPVGGPKANRRKARANRTAITEAAPWAATPDATDSESPPSETKTTPPDLDQAPPTLPATKPVDSLSITAPSPLPAPKRETGEKIRAWMARLPLRGIYVAAGVALIVVFVSSAAIHVESTHHDSTVEALQVQLGKLPILSALRPEAAREQPNPKTTSDFVERGVFRQGEGNLEGAISDFDEALKLDPRNVQAFYRRGLARQGKGDWDGALVDYNHALALAPHDGEAYHHRGLIKQAKGDLDGALADFNQALRYDPKISAAYLHRGRVEDEQKNLDGAIADYNHALELDPKMADAYYARGNDKDTEGDPDGAIADYTQALNLDPANAMAFSNRGFARQGKGDADGALSDYNQALAVDPGLAVVYYNRGLIKEQKGDLDGAIADANQALELDPKNTQAYWNRGMARLGKNDLDGAAEDLRTFCRWVPRNDDVDFARIYLWLIDSQQYPNGTADLALSKSLLNDWNSSPEDMVSKIAAFLLGHISESELIANAASPDLNQDPVQHCKAWYFAGMKRLLGGDRSGAIDCFRKSTATRQTQCCEYLFAQSELRGLDPNGPASPAGK